MIVRAKVGRRSLNPSTNSKDSRFLHGLAILADDPGMDNVGALQRKLQSRSESIQSKATPVGYELAGIGSR